MRDPLFITKTSDLTDEEAGIVITKLDEFERENGYRPAVLVNTASGWCANIYMAYRADWDHIWGRMKTKLYKRRLRAHTL